MDISGNHAIVSGNDYGGGRGYIFRRDGTTGVWTEQQKLVLSGSYVVAVAISGDEAILAIAHGFCVFRRDNGTGIWTEQQKVEVDAGVYEYVSAMCLRDEWLMFAIGNPHNMVGYVYVFHRNSQTGLWTQQQRLQRAGVVSIAINGDCAMIGCIHDTDTDANGENPVDQAGAVYVYNRNSVTGLWTLQQKLVASDRMCPGAVEAYESFGAELVIAGNDAIIGCPGSSSDINGRQTMGSAGAAYVFRRDSSTGVWLQQQKLVASDRSQSDCFGNGLALNGDCAFITGYVFHRDTATGVWTQRQKLAPCDGAERDGLGLSAALGDGFLLLGSWSTTDANGANPVSGSGAVYVFSNAATNHSPKINRIWADSVNVTRPNATIVHVVASDPDGDALTYAWDGGGSTTFATPNSADSSVAFGKDGLRFLSVKVTDGRGGAASATIVVAAQTAWPILMSASNISVPEGGMATVQMKLNGGASGTLYIFADRGPGTVLCDGSKVMGDDGTAYVIKTLNLDSVNWQTLTLLAPEDADTADNTTTFYCSLSAGKTYYCVLTATKADNDTTLTVNSTPGGTATPGGDTVVSKGTATVIRATAETGYAFVNWSATSGTSTFANSNAASTTVTLDAPATIQANFAPSLVLSRTHLNVPEGGTATLQVKLPTPPIADVTVTVAHVTGDGDLTVSSGSISIFNAGNWDAYQTVTLAAAEDADGADGTATFACRAAGFAVATVTATEVDNETTLTTLTVQTGGNGAVIPAGAVSVTRNAPTTINAAASSGSAFRNWIVTSGTATFADAGASNTTVTIEATATIQANFFDPRIVTSVTNVSVPECGTAAFQVKLAADPVGAVTVAMARSGGDADLMIGAGSNLVFTSANWDTFQSVLLVAAEDTDSDDGAATFVCSAPGLISAPVLATEYDKDATVTLTVLNDGNGATTPGGATAVPRRTPIGINATPNAGYAFTNWIVTSGSAVLVTANEANTTVITASNATITANFRDDRVTLTMQNDGHGTTTPSGSTLVPWNVPISISATPNPGYAFLNWNNYQYLSTTSLNVTVSLYGSTYKAYFTPQAQAIYMGSAPNANWYPSTYDLREGNTTTGLVVKLLAPPANDLTVTVACTAGDEDITVAAAASLIFTPTNWDVPQPVVLVAAEDSDVVAGSATITASALGWTSASVSIDECDNDVAVPLVVNASVGGTTTPSGTNTVVISSANSFATQKVSIPLCATPLPGYVFTGWTATDLASKETCQFADAYAATTTLKIAYGSGNVTANFLPAVQRLVASAGTLSVPEGGTASFQIKLASSPATNVTVAIARSPGGDPNLTITAGANLSFTPTNWDTYQTVTVSACEDDDIMNGTATFTCTASNWVSMILTATEADNDTTLTVVAERGGATTPGGAWVVTKNAPTGIGATPLGGHAFVGWKVLSGPATLIDPTAASSSVIIGAPAKVRATFSLSDLWGDPDHDHMCNLDEAWAGTDPTNALSLLALSEAFPNPEAPGEFVIHWQSVTDRTYTVQMATNLLIGFDTLLSTNISATPPENVHTDDVSGAGCKFYRVKVE